MAKPVVKVVKLPRLKKNHKVLFLAGLMLFSVLISVINSGEDPITAPIDEPDYIGSWKGFKIFEENTSINTSIYYLELQPGYSILMRADPREAEAVESPSSPSIYANIYSSSTVFLLFDPIDEGEVGIAYAEMAKFLAGRPFEYVFATTEPYTDEANRTYPFKAPFNTTDDETVIFMRIANDTKIEMENRTITITGEDMWDLATAAAKVQLIMLRIM